MRFFKSYSSLDLQIYFLGGALREYIRRGLPADPLLLRSSFEYGIRHRKRCQAIISW